MALHDVSPRTPSGPARQDGDEILRVTGLEVAYGASAPAIRDVSLHVARGAAVAILGANGAGKTTMMRAISGTLDLYDGRITAGEAIFDGKPINGVDAHRVFESGVSQVPEGRMVFAGLSVEENLLVGASRSADVEAGIEQVLEFFPVLGERRGQQAGWLSGGEQQMLAIGRAMMSSPRLMLLDEVSLGLAPIITDTIFRRLDEIRAETGSAMLLVEQNAPRALAFSDYAYVLENGRLVVQGPSDELASDPQVQELYLGGTGERTSFAHAKRYSRRKWWLS
jgi:branched-chain amino acid transport system ATP-binding protein